MSVIAALSAALMLTQVVSVIENRSTNRRPVVVEATGAQSSAPGRGIGEERDVRTCRQERIIGSNFSRRVCRSRALNAQAREDSQDGLRRLQGSRLPDGQ